MTKNRRHRSKLCSGVTHVTGRKVMSGRKTSEECERLGEMFSQRTRPLPGIPSTERVELDQLMEAIESDEHLGFCLSCGADRDGCEPDARHYECEECGELQVFGAQELLIMISEE